MDKTVLILHLISIICIFGSLSMIVYLVFRIRKTRRQANELLEETNRLIRQWRLSNDIADTRESPIVKLRGDRNER